MPTLDIYELPRDPNAKPKLIDRQPSPATTIDDALRTAKARLRERGLVPRTLSPKPDGGVIAYVFDARTQPTQTSPVPGWTPPKPKA